MRVGCNRGGVDIVHVATTLHNWLLLESLQMLLRVLVRVSWQCGQGGMAPAPPRNFLELHR